MPVAADLYYSFHEGGTKNHPPVVLIHGAGGLHLSWAPNLRRLAGYSVYAVDLSGHGRSGGPGRQTIASYASQVIRLLDQLGLYQAVFVGHSMGGAVALTLAYTLPERVVGLGLISTGATLPIPADLLDDAMNPVTLPRAIQTLRDLSFGFKDNSELGDAVMRQLVKVRSGVLYGDLLACSTFDLQNEVQLLTCPALILTGGKDRLTPLRLANYLAAQIHGAEQRVIPGAGHMLPLAEPLVVEQALVEWLGKLEFQAGGEN